MDSDPTVPYILGRLSAPFIFGLIVYLFFRLTKRRSLNRNEKKIVIIVIVVAYVLMLMSAISRVGVDSY
jgi:hypothetical protein